MNSRKNLEKTFDFAKLPFPLAKFNIVSALCIISTAAFVSFFKSLHAVFVFDDHEAVINNKDVTSYHTSLYDIFFHDFWGASINHIASHKSYRPLTILCFRLLHRLNGGELNPVVFHYFNITLHMVVSCLTFVVYNIMFEMRCQESAFFCALLFAVHPVHTESVVGVVGQAELLSAFFALSSFILFHCGCAYNRSLLSTVSYTFISCILSVVAMLCKEQGITIIGVISIYDIVIVNRMTISKMFKISMSVWESLFGNSLRNLPKIFNCECLENNLNKTNGIQANSKITSVKKNNDLCYRLYPFTPMIIRHVVLLLITGTALYIRWLLMGSTLPVFQKIDNPASFEDIFIYRVINYNYIYLINIWILLCPEWLCFDWSMGCIPLIKSNQLDFRIIFVLLFWLIIGALIYKTYKSTGMTQRALVMGLSTIFILFSPASNIFFKVGFVIAERVLYLPSLGYFLVIVVGLQKLAAFNHAKKLYQVLMMILMLIFMLRSIRRTEDWLSETKLFRSALSVCPLNAKVHYNLAKNAADKGYKKFAIKHYEEAIKLHPKYDLAMNNLANIYRDEGNFLKAEKLLTEALEIRSDFSTAWMNLGIVYSSMGALNESEKCYLDALKYRKRYPDCYYNLGNLYLELGRNFDALVAWRNATFLKPTHKIAWSNLIVMLDSMGRLNEALNESYKALSHLPNEPNIHFNLANVLGKLNKYEESEKHFLRAIQLNAQMPAYHYNLGVLYHRWKKYCKAKFHYSESDRLDPSSKARKQLNSLKKSGKIDRCLLKVIK